MVDIAADEGWLTTTLRVMHLVQMCVQGRWLSDASLLTLPHFKETHLSYIMYYFKESSLARRSDIRQVMTLPEFLILYQQDEKFINSVISKVLGSQQQTKQVSY